MWLLLCLWMPGVAADVGPATPAPSVRTERQADGSVKVVPDRQVPRDVNPAEQVLLEFSEISLFDLTLYMADLMRRNVLVTDEEALKSKVVRFVGHEQMTVDEAWHAYRSALQGHGLALAEGASGLVRIVPRADVARDDIEVGAGRPAGQAITTRLLPVRNARASDLVSILTPLLSAEAQVTAYAPANTLIVTDVASNVRKALELVTALDVAAPESSLRLTRLRHADASAVRAVLEALYPNLEATAPAAPTPTRTRRRARGRSEAPKTTVTSSGEESKRISRILSDERTNTVIVLANAEGHAAVARLIAELDVDVDPSASRSLHVVRLQYAVAEEVAQVLTTLGSQRRSSSSETGRRRSGDERPDPLAVLDGDLRIAPDPATNSLAVVADPRELELVTHLISELDVARGQVFVDAVFVELTNSGGEELALGAHLTDGLVTGSLQTDPEGTFRSLSVSTDLLSGLAAGVFGPVVEVLGLDGDVLQVPTFGIALQALQTSSDVQVMGNPALLTLDHHEARLQVGRRIPFASSTTVTSIGSPIQSYERLDVATELVVTPHINHDELVTMDIQLIVDEVEGSGAESALEGGPVTSGRTVESRVMVEHGETVVIAGLGSTKEEVIRTKVPILGDIPLLGLLFRGKTKITRDTHLLVFLTPYVLESPKDLLAIRRMKEAQRQEFVRRFHGKEGEAWLLELQDLLDDAHDGEPGT